MAIPALAVAHNDILNAASGEHVRGELTGLGTGSRCGDVLCPQPETEIVRAHGGQIRCGGRNHDLHAAGRCAEPGPCVCKFPGFVE